MRLAEVRAGSRAAQAGNVSGDWRRFAKRNRLSFGLVGELAAGELGIDVGYMRSEVEFRRRDVQVDDNRDISLVANWLLRGDQRDWSLALRSQRGRREQLQFSTVAARCRRSPGGEACNGPTTTCGPIGIGCGWVWSSVWVRRLRWMRSSAGSNTAAAPGTASRSVHSVSGRRL